MNPAKVNAKVTVFVSITTNQHNEDWLTRFAKVIGDFPEVIEFYRMSGQIDYLLKVVVPDIEAYDAFYKKLVSKIDIMDVSSAFAMETIKNETALPLGYMQLDPMAKQGYATEAAAADLRHLPRQDKLTEEPRAAGEPSVFDVSAEGGGKCRKRSGSSAAVHGELQLRLPLPLHLHQLARRR